MVFQNWLQHNRKLKGSAQSIAIAFAGTLVNDLREPQKAEGRTTTYELEYYAWQSAVVGALGNRLKTFTVPGGYLLWNANWPVEDRTKSVEDALKSYLANEELLSR